MGSPRHCRGIVGKTALRTWRLLKLRFLSQVRVPVTGVFIPALAGHAASVGAFEREACGSPTTSCRKSDELPVDFLRRYVELYRLRVFLAPFAVSSRRQPVEACSGEYHHVGFGHDGGAARQMALRGQIYAGRTRFRHGPSGSRSMPVLSSECFELLFDARAYAAPAAITIAGFFALMRAEPRRALWRRVQAACRSTGLQANRRAFRHLQHSLSHQGGVFVASRDAHAAGTSRCAARYARTTANGYVL